MSVVFPINPDDRVETYTASAGQTVFAVPFPFQDNRDVEVQKIALDGSTSILVDGVDYAMAGAGGAGGGAFTLSVPANAGEKFRPIGKAVLDRLTSVVRAGKFASKSTDDEFDRNRIVQQEFARDIGRALKADYGQKGGRVDIIAEGNFWKADAAGNMVDGGSAADIINAQGYAAAAGQAKADAAASAAAAASSSGSAAGVLAEMREIFLGSYPDDASVDAAFPTRPEGARYYNTTLKADRVFDGTAWQPAASVGDGTVSDAKLAAESRVEARAADNSRITDYMSAAKRAALRGGGTVNIDAELAAYIAAEAVKPRKTLYFPMGRYQITSAPPALTGSNWSVFGDARDVSEIRLTGDFAAFTLDPTAATMYFGEISDLTIVGANTGADTASTALLVRGNTGSATGAQYWAARRLTISGVHYGIWMQETGKTAFSGFTSIQAHAYWQFDHCVITPTAAVEVGLFAPGWSAHGSTIIGGTYRGSDASIRLGTGGANNSVGDTLIVGVQVTIGDYGIHIRGTSTAGAYNQNITVTGCQIDGGAQTGTDAIKIENSKNFRVLANNYSASAAAVTLVSCVEPYIVENKNSTAIVNSAGTHTISGANVNLTGAVVITDAAGPRYANQVAARRSVNDDALILTGGNVNGVGGQITLYGGAHATYPSGIRMGGTRLAFFGGNPVTKPSTTADIASVRNALISLGLIS